MTAGLGMIFLGYLLAYSAVKGVNPWRSFLDAFGHADAPAPAPGQAIADYSIGTGPGSSDPAGGATGQARGGRTSTPVGMATPAAARWIQAVKLRFPAAVFNGCYSCRKIIPHGGGTSDTWSEHSWGNAVDFTGSAGLQAQIVAYAQANKARFHIVNIIPPGSAVNTVHVDFTPNHAGQTPPCAG